VNTKSPYISTFFSGKNTGEVNKNSRLQESNDMEAVDRTANECKA
jgi:hypothetical protein